jgi:hypothetical protein
VPRRIRQYRHEVDSLGKGCGPFDREVASLMSLALADIGATNESWPHSGEVRVATYIGVRLAHHLATGERGMVEPAQSDFNSLACAHSLQLFGSISVVSQRFVHKSVHKSDL